MTPCATPDSAADGVATTLAWLVGGVPTYAREGNIIASGSALDWMARTLGAPEGVPGGAFVTELAMMVPDSAGVTFVPAFSGLGAPYWDRSATGLLSGLSAGSTPAHLARAALEAVVHQVADIVEAIESDGRAVVSALHADGGASTSALLMQMQADLLRRPVQIASEPEASALGAALLAARALGLHVAEPTPGVRIEPAVTDWRSRRLAWKQAVARSRGHAVNASLDDELAGPDNQPSASTGAPTPSSSDRR
jgi:glycerol kinase